jgi:hypothetical protein
MISTTFIRRKLIELHVVGNVLIDAEYQEDQSCDPSAPTPCFRVLTGLTLFLKADQGTLPLVNRISIVFEDGDLVDILVLAAPFEAVEVTGVTASTPT